MVKKTNSHHKKTMPRMAVVALAQIRYSTKSRENVDKVKAYSEYLAEYSQYLGDITSMKWMSDYDENHSKQTIIETTPTQKQINPNLGWWCQKNKTSNDFWKYKL